MSTTYYTQRKVFSSQEPEARMNRELAEGFQDSIVWQMVEGFKKKTKEVSKLLESYTPSILDSDS